MSKSYSLRCSLDPQVALTRIEALLVHECVTFKTDNLRIVSTRTPFAVLGVQPELYTRKNWIGLNPFAFVSAVDISFKSIAGDATKVCIRVNRSRSIGFVAFWSLCAVLMSLRMPQPAGLFFVFGVAAVSWLVCVSVLGGYLVKAEIRRELR